MNGRRIDTDLRPRPRPPISVTDGYIAQICTHTMARPTRDPYMSKTTSVVVDIKVNIVVSPRILNRFQAAVGNFDYHK